MGIGSDLRRGFLRDQEGQPSCMRLISFGSFLVAGALGVMTMLGETSTAEVVLVGQFLAAAVGGKIGQKHLEGKAPPSGSVPAGVQPTPAEYRAVEPDRQQ